MLSSFTESEDFGALEEDITTLSIHELFVYYNDLYFDSSLGSCTVEWSPQRMTRCAGICYPQVGGGCIIRLSEPLLKLRPSWEFKNTLVHEMIHAWLFLRGIYEANGGHGPKFQRKAQEINESKIFDFQRPRHGYQISIYHTMHEEVRFYQQHHWKCDKCSKLICRAMNRRPQPADCRHFNAYRGKDCSDKDCGYHGHMRSCPHGSFIKVKEPEGYGESKAKRQKGELETTSVARFRSKPSQTKIITDFFRSPANERDTNTKPRRAGQSSSEDQIVSQHVDAVAETNDSRSMQSPEMYERSNICSPAAGSLTIEDNNDRQLKFVCPVCNKTLAGNSNLELNLHIDKCLQLEPIIID